MVSAPKFFDVMTPYVEALAKSNAKSLSPVWKQGLQGILDSYLGKCPESFKYEGKTYTPQSFVESLGLNLDDYVSITSFTTGAGRSAGTCPWTT